MISMLCGTMRALLFMLLVAVPSAGEESSTPSSTQVHEIARDLKRGSSMDLSKEVTQNPLQEATGKSTELVAKPKNLFQDGLCAVEDFFSEFLFSGCIYGLNCGSDCAPYANVRTLMCIATLKLGLTMWHGAGRPGRIHRQP